MDGELIGINGRGSFDKRGRINSGVGYAISINQIKNFMGHLRAGLDADHARLGAIVRERVGRRPHRRRCQQGSRAGDDPVRCHAAAASTPGDELVSFAGWPLTSGNAYKNKLGIYPKGWRVPLVYRHNDEKKEILVRLMGVIRQEIRDPGKPDAPKPANPKGKIPDSPAKSLYEVKDGFSNYYFNKMERDRVLKDFHAHGKFDDVPGTWVIKAGGTVKGKRAVSQITIDHKGAREQGGRRGQGGH